MNDLAVLLAFAMLHWQWLVGFAIFIGLLTWVVDRDEARANRVADKVYRWRR